MKTKIRHQRLNDGLGKSIIRDRFQGYKSRNEVQSMLHTTELNDGASYTKFQSVTEQSNLEEFLNTAELAETDFTAERRNIHIVQTNPSLSLSSSISSPSLTNAIRRPKTPITDGSLSFEHQWETINDKLLIPRRPAWTESMTTEEVNRQEREAFLEWRRSLAR
jgi:large subunit GTPase 1